MQQECDTAKLREVSARLASTLQSFDDAYANRLAAIRRTSRSLEEQLVNIGTARSRHDRLRRALAERKRRVDLWLFAQTCISPGIEVQWNTAKHGNDRHRAVLREECNHPLIVRMHGIHVFLMWSCGNTDDRDGLAGCVVCGLVAQDADDRDNNRVMPLDGTRQAAQHYEYAPRAEWQGNGADVERFHAVHARIVQQPTLDAVRAAFLAPFVAEMQSFST